MEAHLQPAIGFPSDWAAFSYARRLRQEADFELLKSRMLMRAMDETPSMELHILLFRAAAEAAVLALQTPFPMLLFPGLFEEKTEAALKQVRRSWRTAGM